MKYSIGNMNPVPTDDYEREYQREKRRKHRERERKKHTKNVDKQFHRRRRYIDDFDGDSIYEE